MTYTCERYIRFADIDAAGWLYYPRFIEFCHNAFEDWVNSKAPLNYRQMITEQGWGFPAVAVTGNYLAPLTHGDTAVITLKITHIGNSSLKTSFEFVRKHDQVVSFKGEITTVCVSLKEGKSMPIPAEMRVFFEAS
ncbi:MAG: thioesterase family protein [Myxococcaceae bacterium]